MSMFRLEERKIRPVALAAAGLFLLFAGIFFSPIEIPHKIAFTLGSAFIMSLWLCPWQISLALLFSALGDYFGSCHNFLGQMGFFALCHISLIWYFIERYLTKVIRNKKPTTKSHGLAFIFLIMLLAFDGFVFAKVIPCTPEGIIRIGTSIYAVLISCMLYFALLQRSSLFAIGAVLFVFSDFILAWNKFVEPIEYSRLLIMIPYYAGQFLIFMRSTPYKVKPDLRGFRF